MVYTFRFVDVAKNDLEGGRSPTGKSFFAARLADLKTRISVNQIGALECKNPSLCVNSAYPELPEKQAVAVGQVRLPYRYFLLSKGFAQKIALTFQGKVA